MAILSKEWREYQERQARLRIAATVQHAVICYPHDRRPFYRLHGYAGLTCEDVEMQELRRLLAEIANE